MPYRITLTPMDSKGDHRPRSPWTAASLGSSSLVLQIFTENVESEAQVLSLRMPANSTSGSTASGEVQKRYTAPGVIICLSYNPTTSISCTNRSQMRSNPISSEAQACPVNPACRFALQLSPLLNNSPDSEIRRPTPIVHALSPDISYFYQRPRNPLGFSGSRTMTVQIRTPAFPSSSSSSEHLGLFTLPVQSSYPPVTTHTFQFNDPPPTPLLRRKQALEDDEYDYDTDSQEITSRWNGHGIQRSAWRIQWPWLPIVGMSFRKIRRLN